MEKQHSYKATIKWTGNKGTGTDGYSNYERSHQIMIDDKTEISCSSDPAFRGDKTKHNPEELLLSSLSSCHCSGICICVQKQESLLQIILIQQQEQWLKLQMVEENSLRSH